MYTAIVTRFVGLQQSTREYGCDTLESMSAWANAAKRAGWQWMKHDALTWSGYRGSGEHIIVTLHPVTN